jgi:hypothetical protein
LLLSGGSWRDRAGRGRLASLSDKIARNAPSTAINVLAKQDRQRSWLSRLLG